MGETLELRNNMRVFIRMRVLLQLRGEGKGGRDKDKEQCTKLQPLLRDCERATGGE